MAAPAEHLSLEASRSELETQGYLILPGVFTISEVTDMRAGLQSAFTSRPEDEAMRVRGPRSEILFAARNVLKLWPEAVSSWRRSPLPELLVALLGESAGLVRGLYFDKPPERTWALPWHKDLTIAVRDNRLPSQQFARPTTKAGVPHVEAPLEVLAGMATARIHLDDVTEENGPLRVIPGSHRLGKVMPDGTVPPSSILASAGDVLLMRPLLAHASNHSCAGTQRHRRILHLEFAAASLPDGFAWHEFHAVTPARPTSCP